MIPQLIITRLLSNYSQHKRKVNKKEHHDRWMGFKREDVFNWFTEAGLTDVAVDCVGQKCCADSQSETETASVSIFVASGRK
jgi:hypothetical protein